MDKIICLGKNYLEHAQELGDAVPEFPVVFFKPPSSLQQFPKTVIHLPRDLGSTHYECELVLRVKRDFKLTGSLTDAFDAVTVGLDLTLRDLQSQLKKNGHPWEVSKAFKHSAWIGEWCELSNFDRTFFLDLNHKRVQTGQAQEMRVSPLQALQHLGRTFEIVAGDLLFTGTPKGVGPLAPGQTLQIGFEGGPQWTLSIL